MYFIYYMAGHACVTSMFEVVDPLCVGGRQDSCTLDAEMQAHVKLSENLADKVRIIQPALSACSQ